MGILNVTPDSFSGDGVGADVEAAVARAKQLAGEGADIIDVGGESTRPGAPPISVEEELSRLIPVIERLAAELTVPISVDSYKSAVAEKALEAGARMLNDQWGLKHDPRLAELAARFNVPIILMSNQRDKGGYDAGLKRDTADYADPIAEIISSLKKSLEIASRSGVPRENVVIDPGIGFGKSWRHDLEIIRRLAELKELGRPLLIGPSGKSFIGKVLDLPIPERLEGAAAAVAIGIANGADLVRVHQVGPMVRVCRMVDAIVRRRQSGD
jgi:dihydropteroate synthase